MLNMFMMMMMIIIWLTTMQIICINNITSCFDNSADKLCHPKTDVYSAEQVLLNKQQIWDGGACLHYYRRFCHHIYTYIYYTQNVCKHSNNITGVRTLRT